MDRDKDLPMIEVPKLVPLPLRHLVPYLAALDDARDKVEHPPPPSLEELYQNKARFFARSPPLHEYDCSPPAPGFRFGHQLSTGSSKQLDPDQPVPDILHLSMFSSSRTSIRPYEILAFESHSWQSLLQGLMFHGRNRIEPAPLDLSQFDNPRASLKISFLKDDTDKKNEYRVRLYLTLEPSTPPKPKLNTLLLPEHRHALKRSNSSFSSSPSFKSPPSSSSSPSFSPPHHHQQPVRQYSRSGINKNTQLPYIISLAPHTVHLPITFSELGLELDPIGEAAFSIARTGTFDRSLPIYMDPMSLRELGQSCEFVRRHNSLYTDNESIPTVYDPDQSRPSSSSSSSLSTNNPVSKLKSHMQRYTLRHAFSTTKFGVEIPGGDKSDNFNDSNNYKHSKANYITPFNLDELK